MNEDNKPLFDQSMTNKISHPLIRALRLLYAKLGITEQMFRDLHHRYFTMLNPGSDAYEISGDRSNEKKLIKNDKRLSWRKFIRGAVDIPDLELMETIYRFRNPKTGEVFDISTLDRINKDGEYEPYQRKGK